MMAEPISAAASIAGLVTLADVVFGRIFKYVQTARKADEEITALSSEIGALYGILSRLNLVSRQLVDDFVGTAPRMHYIGSCQETLEKVRTILDRDTASSARTQHVDNLRRKLRWPFRSSEVKTLLAEIERHKATLGLALNVDGMTGLLQSLSLQGTIRDTVDEIKRELKQKHEADVRIAIDAKRQTILRSFGNIDPCQNQKMSIKLRQPGTGSWLIESQEYRDWCQTGNRKLWLYGIPGAGKTILASTMIEEALRGSNANNAVAFFYCDYKDPATQKPQLILGSLIQQIAKQDEQAFEKVAVFCDNWNTEHRKDYDYDCQELRDLLLEISCCFDSATILVDGLDECGANTPEMMELLTSLNADDVGADIRTLFLSRDEVEIRERLGDYCHLAVAARSSDLRLYVGAEIEQRIRKNKLRIKDHSLKEYIMNRLVEGAEGMFRWVACQMDYLCELPNDKSRRKALGDLPRGLNATYERILRRVNTSSTEVQLLVSRTLRWIIYSHWNLPTPALCEAISLNLDDTRRDTDSIPDEVEILRWCSSLVRKSPDGNYLELAHFTVQEFLLQIVDDDEGEFAIFRIGPGHDEIELAKVYLTYLTFQDFDEGQRTTIEDSKRRRDMYPLREYAVGEWFLRAEKHLGDEELSILVKRLLDPSKPGAFISWVQDFFLFRDFRTWTPEKIDTLIAETTPLHFAALLDLPEICAWLIESGCDVNRNSVIGSPIYCVMVLMELPVYLPDTINWVPGQSVTEILLEADADPNYYHVSSRTSTLFASLNHGGWEASQRLLEKGAKLDEHSLAWLERSKALDDPSLKSTVENIRIEDVQDEYRRRVLKLYSRIGKYSASNLFGVAGHNSENAQLQTINHAIALSTAARFGQIQAVAQLLMESNVDIGVAEPDTGLTALHHAAITDHPNIVKLLCSHGARYNQTDNEGKTTLHHAARHSWRCLEYLLEQAVDDIEPDNNGLVLWHEAASAESTKSLDILKTSLTRMLSLKEMRTITGWSPLLCAASRGATECIDWLLDAGCTIMDTAIDGSTALHVASKSGSLRSVQRIIDHGCDINSVTNDGSTALHYALLDVPEGVSDIVRMLLEGGIDVNRCRDDGLMPIHLLIAHGVRGLSFNAQDRLTIAGFILNQRSTVLDQILRDRSLYSDEVELIFNIFLANKLDLSTQSPHSNSILRSLVDVWQFTCSRYLTLSPTKSMLRTAVEKIPLTGPLHVICTDPKLIVSALSCEDEEMVYKLLEHSPDVDARVGDTSIMMTACEEGCSPVLFEQLLGRSSTGGDNSSFLRLACQGTSSKSRGVVKLLLDKGFDTNEQSPTDSRSPLMIAARQGDVDIVNLLISHGADMYALDKAGCNVVHYACLGGHVKILRVLKDSPVDWNCRGEILIHTGSMTGACPLHVAARFEDGVLEYLLNENLITDIDQVTDQSESALRIATWSRQPKNVASLLSRGANAAIKDTMEDTGECPIHVAARLGDKAIVSLFLQYGCNVEVLDDQGLTCEMLARKNGNKEVVEMLKGYSEKQAQGFATTTKISKKPAHLSRQLQVAIEVADIDLCQRLVDDGADLSMGFDVCQWCTPILYALRYSPRTGNRLQIIELLAGKEPSTKRVACDLPGSMRGYTTLHYAAAFGHLRLLQILLDKSPMMIFELGTSVHPFHLAILEGHYDCVEMIVAHYKRYTGHDFWCSDRSHRNVASVAQLVEMQVTQSSTEQPSEVKTEIDIHASLRTSRPLQIAAKSGHTRIAESLLKHGASTDATDDFGWTALHFAMESETDQTSTVELLLDHGANVQALNRHLETPLILAASFGKPKVLKVLIDRGADVQALTKWNTTVFHQLTKIGAIPMTQYLLVGVEDHCLAFEDAEGWSPISLLLADGTWNEILFTLNLAPNPKVYEPRAGNILTSALQSSNLTPSLLKKLLKRLSPTVVTTLLRHRAKVGGSPLYAACTIACPTQQENFIQQLLQAGADLEQEGGRHGTPLMGACAAGRFEVVQLLISKGAQISYRKDETTISALDAAKHFPKIVRWLLVERYTKGPRRLCWK